MSQQNSNNQGSNKGKSMRQRLKEVLSSKSSHASSPSLNTATSAANTANTPNTATSTTSNTSVSLPNLRSNEQQQQQEPSSPSSSSFVVSQVNLSGLGGGGVSGKPSLIATVNTGNTLNTGNTSITSQNTSSQNTSSQNTASNNKSNNIRNRTRSNGSALANNSNNSNNANNNALPALPPLVSNVAKSLPSPQLLKQRQVFAVRILLPRDITTILLCDDQTTVDDLVLKALQKLQMLLGIAFDRQHVDLAMMMNGASNHESTLDGLTLLEPDLVLFMLPVIQQQLANQWTPVLELLYRRDYSGSSVKAGPQSLTVGLGEMTLSSLHSVTQHELTRMSSTAGMYASSRPVTSHTDGHSAMLASAVLTAGASESSAQSAHPMHAHPSPTSMGGSAGITRTMSVMASSPQAALLMASAGSQRTTSLDRRPPPATISFSSLSMSKRSLSFAVSDMDMNQSQQPQPSSSSLQSGLNALRKQSTAGVTTAPRSRAALEVTSTSKPVRPSSMAGIPRTPAHIYLIEFQFMDSVSLKMEVSGQDSIASIKQNLWHHPQLPVDVAGLCDQHRLLYTHPEDGFWVELFDEEQLLFMVSAVDYWVKENSGQAFVMYVMNKSKPATKQLQLLNKKIGNLIGFGLYRFDYLKDFEVDVFRRNMVLLRQEALQKRDPMFYTLQSDVDTSPASATLLQRIGPGMKIQFRLHIQNQKMVKTLTCAVNDTPSKIIEQFLAKNRFGAMVTTKVEDYVLKVAGANEFLVGETQVLDFCHVRRCLMREERIELLLIPVHTISVTQPPLIEEFDVIEDPTVLRASHAQLTGVGDAASVSNTLSLYDVAKTVSFQVVACERLQPGTLEAIYVEANLHHGGKILAPTQYSHQVPATRDPRWSAWINFDIAWYNIPRTTKLTLTVWGRWNARRKRELDRDNDVFPLGCVNFQLIDFRGRVKTGLQKLSLTPGEKANPIATSSGWAQIDDPVIFLRLDSFAMPVIVPALPSSPLPSESEQGAASYEIALFSSSIDHLLCYNLPLQAHSKEESQLLWNQRQKLINRPEALAHILQAANWAVMEDVIEAKKLVSQWSPLPPDRALVLLDSSFADLDVRAYAVKQLEALDDHQLLDYLMQLIQALKYEPYLDNPLTRFLLRRSLASKRVGHHFFWYLRAEIDDQTVMLRHSLLLEAYLRGCGSYLDELVHQFEVHSRINELSIAVKSFPRNPAERRECLLRELSQCQWPAKFQLALDPSKELCDVLNDQFRVMDSKKVPIWCVFANSDSTGDSVQVIYKSGDDLRQDMLTLQLIRVMDRLWQSANLDLYMMPYGCISTSVNAGFIEVVQNAETVSYIQLTSGGSSAAFRDQPIDEWLRKQNPNDAEYEKAVEVFTRSCAGYCVATYVLGIGDRHNDNIMVTKFGHLFHIDFGHFLGNIKRKFGIKRERAPFVLTPDFVYVISKRSKDTAAFDRFIQLCVDAYLIIRRYSHLFVTLFSLMISTGIPELRSIDDLDYLREALCLGQSEEEAAQTFRNLIHESLRLGWSTQLNWWLHNLVHHR